MHRRISSWITPLPTSHGRLGLGGWLAVAGIAAVPLFFLITHPLGTLSVFAVFVGMTLLLEYKRSQQVRALVDERPNEDIGSFARAFNRRGSDPVDPWAIRAVWNALVPMTESKGRRIPLRPTDRVDTDLAIDPEDFEDLVPALVEQCERVSGNWEANPYYRRLSTVADLVYFISAQPLRRSA
jgi:hypothetical protein